MAANKGRDVDLAEVERLVQALERDLEKLPSDAPDVQRLRDEVQTLKNVLESPVRREHWIRDSLHGVRDSIEGMLDTASASKTGRYVAEIARILGM